MHSDGVLGGLSLKHVHCTEIHMTCVPMVRFKRMEKIPEQRVMVINAEYFGAT